MNFFVSGYNFCVRLYTVYFLVQDVRIVICASESVGCWWNISSGDHSVTELDALQIFCKIHHVGTGDRPSVQCLPDRSVEVASNIGVSPATSTNGVVILTYVTTIRVTSRLNNVKFKCDATYTTSSIQTPVDVHLWNSPAINVTCKCIFLRHGHTSFTKHSIHRTRLVPVQ